VFHEFLHGREFWMIIFERQDDQQADVDMPLTARD